MVLLRLLFRRLLLLLILLAIREDKHLLINILGVEHLVWVAERRGDFTTLRRDPAICILLEVVLSERLFHGVCQIFDRLMTITHLVSLLH